MNNPYNKLSDAEAERIAILMEECAEVIKTCGKILRHGYESFDPTGKEPGSNREQLESELGDCDAIIAIMSGSGDVSEQNMSNAFCRKTVRFHKKKYLHHQ